MIERQFVSQNIREHLIEEYVCSHVSKGGHSHTKLQRTPLGEKIIIYASRPGLIVGRKGANIKKLTVDLKKKFKLENPQIEIAEVQDIFLDAQLVAEMIASSLERFGTQKFKGIGHKMLSSVMDAKALGVEILITGKIPGSRAKRWRFYQGYLKKCGDTALTNVDKAYTTALLKTGSIGIQVSIMPPGKRLPDDIKVRTEAQIEEVKLEKEKKAAEAEEKKETKKKPAKRKRAPAKKKAAPKKKEEKEAPKKKEEKPKKETKKE